MTYPTTAQDDTVNPAPYVVTLSPQEHRLLLACAANALRESKRQQEHNPAYLEGALIEQIAKLDKILKKLGGSIHDRA